MVPDPCAGVRRSSRPEDGNPDRRVPVNAA